MSGILLTSDWHWADRSEADVGDRRKAQQVLQAGLAQGIDSIAMLGDWIDYWRAPTRAIVEANRKDLVRLGELLNERKIWLYWILGNHDNYPIGSGEAARLLNELGFSLYDVRSSLQIGRWTLSHGQEFDRINSGRARFGKWITRLSAWAERKFPWFDENKWNPRNKISPSRNPDLALALHDTVNEWAADKRKFIAYGHSHHSYELYGHDWGVVNVGACARNAPHTTLTILNPATETISYREL